MIPLKHHCVATLLLALLLSGCVSGHSAAKMQAAAVAKTPASNQTKQIEHRPVPPALALRQRLFLPDDRQTGLPEESADLVYSFKANALPVTQALTMFARTYNLNIIVNPDVITGSVTVNFHDVPFDQAMEAILHATGYYWHRDGKLIFVEAQETRQFSLNSLGTRGDPKNDDNLIWKDLASKLKTLLSAKGTLVLSKLTGTIQVTDTHPNVEAVAQFLNGLRQSISRQVEIDMKILEVTLSDNTSLGIDWSRLNVGGAAAKLAFSTANVIAAPAGGFSALSPSLTINTSNGNIKSVIQALSEQGKVKILSQPRIRTLNNQPALIKVGTDRTFITQDTTTTTGTSSTTAIGFTKDVVPEGLELNVTPQISADGWVMLEVKPKLTRVSSVTEAKDSSGNVLSSGPNLDVRETSSLVRIHDGQTAVMGGLIQTTKSDTERGVPILSKIPLLGLLFKGSNNIKKRTELVIFLTPHLIGPASDKTAHDTGNNF